ncbi:50S ribosomal protein L27 [bacterium]|nr:MAG: 50S ribosomal protein L27 [bacterium]
MIGGFSTPKKDKMTKVCQGQSVKTGQILVRRMPAYKAGVNVGGRGVLFALCDGKVSFSKKKTSHGRPRTFLSVIPDKK